MECIVTARRDSTPASEQQSVPALPLLSDAETQTLLAEWNSTQAEYATHYCIHELFEQQVSRTPDAIAAFFEGQSLSYRELNKRANQLAQGLVKLGVGPDILAGICMERCLEMAVAIFGILKAGGAYVPLDPNHPKERLASILADTNSPVVLTVQDLAGRLPETGARIVALDSAWPAITEEDCEKPVTGVNAGHCAYVIFTSGSTGKPKGVLIPHKAIVNHMCWMCDAFEARPADRVLQRTPYTFDASVWEFYLPVICGAALVIARPGGHIEPTYLADLVASEKVTIVQFVPSILRIFLEGDSVARNTSLRYVFCGGEALTADLQELFFERLNCDLYNLYGPTECTIDSTFWRCRKDWQHPVLPIGKPVANLQAYILDRNLDPVPIYEVGELYIGGTGVGRGYLNRPELTPERFVPDPFSNQPGARIYKTGDLARYLPGGDIEYLGRMDQQVKLHGLRIELGEIETALGAHPEIRQSVVVAQDGPSGEKRLVAYIVLRPGAKLDRAQLRSFLLKTLPDYMVPSIVVTLDAMPLMHNGKVDRRALPAVDSSSVSVDEDLVEPRDILETRLLSIWENVLGVHPIGVRSSFFDLGGHSMMAVRLMRRVEQEFGKKLPLAALFQAPTIEQLAEILRQNGWSPSWSSLVPIQASGSKPPFFCVHGIEANVLRFRYLAQYLGSDQPFYGLQARGVNESSPCDTRVEDMAAHYLREIRRVQPQGPYFLGGYSFGGTVAFEIAQQLTAQGEEPPLVVLFDTHCSSLGRTPFHWQLGSTFSAIRSLLRSPLGQERTRLALTRKVVKRRLQNWVRMVTYRFDPRAIKLPAEVRKVRKACLEASQRYVPRPYSGRIILFRTACRVLLNFSDPREDWSLFAIHGLETFTIKGDHDNILLEPTVQRVAEQLRTRLNNSPGADRSLANLDSGAGASELDRAAEPITSHQVCSETN